jgi:hypothetical protein
VPGISTQCAQTCGAGSQDVGGASGDSRTTLTVHGSRFRDQRIAINGMTIAGSTGGLTMTGPNMEAMAEVQLETTSADAQTSTGGVRINVVPKDGGNTFSGSAFITGTNEDLQADNFSKTLEDRGLVEGGVPRVKKLYDVAGTFGGPIQRDKVWFFFNVRKMSNETYVGNRFINANAFDATKWTYVPDLSQPVTHSSPIAPVGLRITWQATPRNKFAVSADFRDRCDCPNVADGGTASEAATDFMFKPDNVIMAMWSSPVTSRLLLEGTFVYLPLGWGNRYNPEANALLTQVTSQNAPSTQPGTYRGVTQFNWTNYPFWNAAFTATYVTGAHAFKAGWNQNWGYAFTNWTQSQPLSSIRINQATGLPNQFTVESRPRQSHVKMDRETGAFVQDRWTAGRLTLSGGLRYDYVRQRAPEITLTPTAIFPNLNYTFPDKVFKEFHDISPRTGVAYDLFGNGKTAIKLGLNRYVTDESLGSGTNTIIGSPQVYFQYNASRSWTDDNGNFHPDCDWVNGATQDLRSSGGDRCGAWTGASANFGRPAPGTVADDDAVFGWGNRGANWEFSTSVQQELVPGRVAVDVGYFRRWYGNFTVTDNLAVAATDYSAFSVVVPTDPRLPLSGQTISGFLNINPNAQSRPTDNHVQLAGKDEQYENWQGVDVILSARLGGGTLLSGGFSTGRTVKDNCGVVQRLPESGITNQQGLSNTLLGLTGGDAPLAGPFCHQETPYLTQVKMLGTYTVPRIDVQLAGTFQSLPGPMITASLVVPAAQVIGLGRALAGNAANVTVPIVEVGSFYGDRLNQFDFRVGKIIRLPGNRRVTGSVDIFNVLNSDAVLEESGEYASLRAPQRVVGGRLIKFTAQFNF